MFLGECVSEAQGESRRLKHLRNSLSIWEILPKFFKVLVCNPCKSSPSSTILIPLWFIAIPFEFLCLSKLLFSCFLQFKRNSGRGQNNLKFHDFKVLKEQRLVKKHYFSFLFREWRTYFKDPYNYFDWLGLILTFLVIPLRFSEVKSQWTVAGLGYLFNFLRLFKFSCVTRYYKVIGKFCD